MALGLRTIQVNFTMPNGEVVTLDQTLDLHVSVKRNAYHVQQHAEITVLNLSSTLRQTLLTRISAYHNNRVQIGLVTSAYIPVQIIVGYSQSVGTSSKPSVATTAIFTGQAFMATPIGELPSLGVRITCATNQVDKTRVPTSYPPSQTTFKQLVAYVAGQIGCNYICQTSVDDVVITNPLASAVYVGEMVKMLAANVPVYGWVEAFIDIDGTLIVRDLGASIAGQQQILIDEIIGQPYPTEWGIQFKVLYDKRIRMISNLQIQSTQNAWLNGPYVPFAIEYELASRDNSFYTTVNAAFPSNAQVASS